MKIGININEYVYVTLNKAGIIKHNLYYMQYGYKINQSKLLDIQLETINMEYQIWEFMKIFGKDMTLASAVPFVNNEIIVDIKVIGEK